MRAPRIEAFYPWAGGFGGNEAGAVFDGVLHILPLVLILLALRAARPAPPTEGIERLTSRLRTSLYLSIAVAFGGVFLVISSPGLHVRTCTTSYEAMGDRSAWLAFFGLFASVLAMQAIFRLTWIWRRARQGLPLPFHPRLAIACRWLLWVVALLVGGMALSLTMGTIDFINSLQYN